MEKIIESIVEECGYILYDQYIDQLVHPYTIDWTESILSGVCEMEYLRHEQPGLHEWSEGPEPVTVKTDV